MTTYLCFEHDVLRLHLSHRFWVYITDFNIDAVLMQGILSFAEQQDPETMGPSLVRVVCRMVLHPLVAMRVASAAKMFILTSQTSSGAHIQLGSYSAQTAFQWWLLFPNRLLIE